jgi:hypothetical protein
MILLSSFSYSYIGGEKLNGRRKDAKIISPNGLWG